MKIIFLDIDGVLNSRIYDGERNWNEQTDIDETRLPLVKQIVDRTGARIVLSSTWRVHWSVDPRLCDNDGVYINKTFEKFGLEIYDKTPELDRYAERYDEIKKYLADAGGQIDGFVIIDDSPFGWQELNEFFVKTNPHFGRGLEPVHVERAIEILNTPL